MELKPDKGLRVKVNAKREAVFGDDSVSIKPVSIPNGSSALGVLTGTTLAGFCEVEMPSLDSRKHWYPITDLTGENGEQLTEEEVRLEADEGDVDEDLEE